MEYNTRWYNHKLLPNNNHIRHTHNRKNTVIRKNDLAIVNESKPRLMHFLACTTVREHNRNQEKITDFLFAEKKTNKQAQNKQPPAHCNREPSYQMVQPGPSSRTEWLQPAKNKRPQKKSQQTKRKGTAPTKRSTKTSKEFEQRSKESALVQPKFEEAKKRQRKSKLKFTTHLNGHKQTPQINNKSTAQQESTKR